MSLLTNPDFTESFTVTRQSSSGSWVSGRWVDAASPTTLTIQASVQRLTPKETEMLPEAYRTKRAYRVYTQTALRTVDLGAQETPDTIEIDGADYDIVDVEYWRQIYAHYKAIAVRKENAPL